MSDTDKEFKVKDRKGRTREFSMEDISYMENRQAQGWVTLKDGTTFQMDSITMFHGIKSVWKDWLSLQNPLLNCWWVTCVRTNRETNLQHTSDRCFGMQALFLSIRDIGTIKEFFTDGGAFYDVVITNTQTLKAMYLDEFLKIGGNDITREIEVPF